MQTIPNNVSRQVNPHQTLARIDENIWEATAPLKLPGLRMDHRMTVVRLHSGELVIHSPLEYSSILHRAILEVGSPKWFVAPSRFHDLYWPQWFGGFPRAQFIAAPGIREDLPELPFSDVLGETANFWDGELLPLAIRGMPRVNEFALLHPASRSLIVADLMFNIDPAAQNAFGRLFLRLNGIYRKPGISRIIRACIKDKTAFCDSLQEILSHNFDRTIIGHGPNLGGRAVLKEAAREAGLVTSTSTRCSSDSA
jgi:hypothetical protein